LINAVLHVVAAEEDTTATAPGATPSTRREADARSGVRDE
jgi:hypothetical protein